MRRELIRLRENAGPEEIARRVSFRLQRQQVLTRQPYPLRLRALLDASVVLLRTTGDAAVMAEQVDHLRAGPDAAVLVADLRGHGSRGDGLRGPAAG